MDAHCALCAKGARWIAHSDKAEKFRIIPLQSERGKALMRHFGMDPEDPTSWLFLDQGTAHHSLDATMAVGQHLGGIWHLFSVFKLLPKGARNGLYRLVARNRYKLFGTEDMCAMPDPKVQARLLR